MTTINTTKELNNNNVEYKTWLDNVLNKEVEEHKWDVYDSMDVAVKGMSKAYQARM